MRQNRFYFQRVLWNRVINYANPSLGREPNSTTAVQMHTVHVSLFYSYAPKNFFFFKRFKKQRKRKNKNK